MDILFDLQIFAEGAEGATAATAGGSTGVTAAPDMQANTQQADNGPIAGDTTPQPRNRNPLADVQYGRQEPQAAPQQQDIATTEDTPKRASFDELIAGEYKADYEARIQATIQDRLKGSKAREEKVAPILQALAAQYGVDMDDLDGIAAAFDNDLSRYEKTALEQGVSPETAARLTKIKAMEQQRVKREEAARQEEQTRQHFRGLQQQAEEMKQLYPGFDLQRELSDPKFFRMTSPEGGLTLKEAYQAIHGEEITAAGMQYAVERSQAKVAASVQANSARPREGGLRRAAATEVKTDPTKLTKMDRAEIKRRVARGEKIVW